jgi:hypothetical protein
VTVKYRIARSKRRSQGHFDLPFHDHGAVRCGCVPARTPRPVDWTPRRFAGKGCEAHRRGRPRGEPHSVPHSVPHRVSAYAPSSYTMREAYVSRKGFINGGHQPDLKFGAPPKRGPSRPGDRGPDHLDRMFLAPTGGVAGGAEEAAERARWRLVRVQEMSARARGSTLHVAGLVRLGCSMTIRWTATFRERPKSGL